MAENETPQGDTAPEGATATEPDAPNEVEAWKGHARKWQSRAQENLALVKQHESRIAELEESLTAEAERREAAEKAQADSERLLIRYEVAAEKGLSADLLELLKGDSREELEAAADKLIEFKGVQAREDYIIPDLGKTPNVKPTTPAQVFAEWSEQTFTSL